jgi:hypothetical protein
MMFEVQWSGRSMGRFSSERSASLWAQECAFQFLPLAVVEQPAGRVVAVFGSSGKRLTFPIATAIAYAALAQKARADGHRAGYANGLAACKFKEHKP